MQRYVKTKFYIGKRYHDPVQINSASDANTAVATCVLRMQINQYSATSAEVYDDNTGELHAIVTRSINGQIRIDYRRDPVKFETRLAIGALFGKDKK
jgi:hypothetical protein